MSDKPCPFCNLDGERNRVLFENPVLSVVLSNPRLMKGHTLVIPKRHVGALFELPSSEQQEVFNVALQYQNKLIEVFSRMWEKPAGCDLSCHTRPFMPQTELSIPGHGHIHLRPRYWKDEYYEGVLKHETDMFVMMEQSERDGMHYLLGG